MTTSSRQQRPAFSLRVLLALSFVGLCIAALVFQAASPVARAATTKANASSVSPLIFGTNLQLYGNSDSFLTDSHYVPLLQQIHTQIIRIPSRAGVQESVLKAAAQKVHDMGAAALVILGGQVRTNPLADDTPVIQDMNTIFGTSRVYYEFGNEEDLNNPPVTAAQYTDQTPTSWNAVIPKLKSIANNAFFIGPVNYQYDDAYLRYFLQHANPRPDAVSWHMYTCDTSGVYKHPADTESNCLANLDNWTQHFSDARTAMHSILGGNTELPIIISEWNYDALKPIDNGDNNFINTWTTKALGLLASNNAFASMQYAVDALTPLISNDQLTQQARTFQSEYTQLVGGGSSTPTPTPTLSPTATSTSTPTPPTPTPPPTSGFGFEDGTTQGWGTNGNVTAVGSTDYAYVGTHSLEVKFPGTGSGDYPYTSVAGSHLSPSPQTGQTLTAYVYVPGSVSLSVSGWLFVQDSNFKWYKESPVTITKGAWKKLTFTVPANANQIGIQFNGTGSGSVYVDEMRWG